MVNGKAIDSGNGRTGPIREPRPQAGPNCTACRRTRIGSHLPPTLAPKSRLHSLALFCLLAMSVLLAETLPAAEQVGSHQLPAFARSLRWDPGNDTLVASMALNGVAFLKMKGEEVVGASHHPDWATLDSLPLGGGRYLLAGRFNELILAEPTSAPDPVGPRRYKIAARWEVEGVPTGLHYDGTSLLVASGGAGLLRYEWPGNETEPRLRARYPFVDYSKEVSLASDGRTAYLADNHDTGLQVLDLSDPLRIRQVTMFTGDFVDSVARHSDTLAIARRRVGVLLYDISTPTEPRQMARIRVADRRGAIVNQVRFDNEGRLLVCDNAHGARLYQILEMDEGLVPDLLAELPVGGGSAGASAFLGGDLLALAGVDGLLTFTRIEGLPAD